MNDRPTADELLAAVRDYLLTEVAPAAPAHRDRFRALIAANVLAIVRRELTATPGTTAGLAAVAELLGDDRLGPDGRDLTPAELAAALAEANRSLAAHIRSGAADDGPHARAVRDLVRRQVEAKLAVNNPTYLTRFATT